MKTTLFVFATTLLISFSVQQSAQAQQCYLLRDSTIYNTDTYDIGDYIDYAYDMNFNIVRADMRDSVSGFLYRYDTLYYTGNQLDSVATYNFDGMNAHWRKSTYYTYNGSNQIVRIEVQSMDNMQYSFMAHDILYNGSNQVSDIVLDTATIVGNPDGMVASFMNIHWSNGNPDSVWLIGDLGSGFDTFELAAQYDNKKNLERLTYVEEGSEFLLSMAQNNITYLTLVEDESLGAAGSVALKQSYSYTVDDEVAQMTNHPKLFETDSIVRQYTYDCMVTSVSEIDANAPTVNIYPNPFEHSLTIDVGNSFDQSTFDIEIRALDGRLLYQQNNLRDNIVTIDQLQDLSAGVYFLTLRNDKTQLTKKIIK